MENSVFTKCRKQKCRNVFFLVRSERRGGFFCKPPAFHRLPFMSPFAGDIRAGPGSLKWIAQIPRKVYRWSLWGDSKYMVLAPNVKAPWIAGLLFMPPVTHGKLERLQFCLCSKRPRKKKGHFGCGMRFSDRAPDFWSESWGDVDQKLRIRLLSISIYPRAQCEGGAMQNSTRKAWFNISLTPL